MEICIVCHKPIEGYDYSDGNFVRDHHYVWHFECDEPVNGMCVICKDKPIGYKKNNRTYIGYCITCMPEAV